MSHYKFITKLEFFIYYLTRIDKEMIETILDDSITYFGASKSMFIDKLIYVFTGYKKRGIKKLYLKRHKWHPKIYYLCSKKLDFFNKFRIVEESVNILNIYNDRIIGEDDFNSLPESTEFTFGDDEKKDFKPDLTYSGYLELANAACENIFPNRIFPIDRFMACVKMFKRVDEYASEHYRYIKFGKFRQLYLIISTINDALKYSDLVRMALNEFETIEPESYRTWLYKYDYLVYCKFYVLTDSYQIIDQEKSIMKYDIIDKKIIYILSKDLVDIAIFMDLVFKIEKKLAI